MEERLKRIEKFTKAMRELLAKMLEEDPIQVAISTKKYGELILPE